jgi:hypothetical protein
MARAPSETRRMESGWRKANSPAEANAAIIEEVGPPQIGSGAQQAAIAVGVVWITRDSWRAVSLSVVPIEISRLSFYNIFYLYPVNASQVRGRQRDPGAAPLSSVRFRCCHHAPRAVHSDPIALGAQRGPRPTLGGRDCFGRAGFSGRWVADSYCRQSGCSGGRLHAEARRSAHILRSSWGHWRASGPAWLDRSGRHHSAVSRLVSARRLR